MLNKEECEKALEVLDCKAHYGCDKGYSQDEELCKICENKDFIEMDVLEQLIKEHFEPQPYEFEDLKNNMWVWDDKKMDFYHVCEKIVNKDGTKILANETHYRLFEENRFFPITKALEYQ